MIQELKLLKFGAFSVSHYGLCETCGGKHDKTVCPFPLQSAPTVFWVNQLVTQKYNLDSPKRPKTVTDLAEEIREQRMQQQKEIDELPVPHINIMVTSVTCELCQQEGHLQHECPISNE